MSGVVRLADVENAVMHGEDMLFEHVAVYVTNFEAPCSWPSKYTYRACNARISEGRQCLLSLERKKFCQEGHIRGVFRPVYRFQLHLADGSMEGRAFKATVFNSAAVPLGRSASELRALPFSLQEQIVTECCQKRERFLVSIRTGRGKPVVEDMTRVDDPSAVEIGRGGFKQIVDCVMHMFGLLTLKRAER